MQSVSKVLYFIAILSITIFIVVFISFFGAEDYSSPALDVQSLSTNLFWTVRRNPDNRNSRILSSDGSRNDFYATWNLISDPSGTGCITFRNAYSGGWLYFTPQDNGSSPFVTVDLSQRQSADIDPIGWFYIRTELSTDYYILFESLQTPGMYLRSPTINSVIYFSIVSVSPIDDFCRFRLVGD